MQTRKLFSDCLLILYLSILSEVTEVVEVVCILKYSQEIEKQCHIYDSFKDEQIQIDVFYKMCTLDAYFLKLYYLRNEVTKYSNSNKAVIWKKNFFLRNIAFLI